MTTPTLEQRRAKHAWQRCGSYDKKDQVNLAKALPALIMNSGLMQVMAFLHEKDGIHEELGKDLRDWLRSRFGDFPESDDFEGFMEHLLNAPPDRYREVTAEAFAWLKWLRQMAAARKGSD